jgi:RNA recognition motif-containing protein
MHKVPIDYTSIFIGQLNCKTDEVAVRERFEKYGNIVGVQVLSKASILGYRSSDGGMSGMSGFAFVKYDGRESATKAVKAEVFPFHDPFFLKMDYFISCDVLKLTI